MNRTFAVARPWSDLRPVKGAPATGKKSQGFPVYVDLESVLANPGPVEEPDPIARHVCSVLAGWAYSDADTVATMMSRLGLEDCRVGCFDVANNAMFIRSTAYLVQSGDGRVALLAYRGTDPFDISTWAVDADVNQPALLTLGNVRVHPDSAASVHAGFYRNQRATWFEIAGRLKRALAGESILRDEEAASPSGRRPSRKLEALYLTGHSLGAAMATIAAFKIGTIEEYAKERSDFRAALRQVYLFAPPMVGDAEFRNLWSGAAFTDGHTLDSRTFAHTFERDVVPHVPPEGTTAYVHVGRHFMSKKLDDLRKPGSYEWVETRGKAPAPCTVYEMGRAVEPVLFGHITWRQLLGSHLGPIFEKVEKTAFAPPLSFADHSPTNYVLCSQPATVNSEFGDDF